MRDRSTSTPYARQTRDRKGCPLSLFYLLTYVMSDVRGDLKDQGHKVVRGRLPEGPLGSNAQDY
eukprot:3245189-Prorocentrum_lima.AAC.1